MVSQYVLKGILHFTRVHFDRLIARFGRVSKPRSRSVRIWYCTRKKAFSTAVAVSKFS